MIDAVEPGGGAAATAGLGGLPKASDASGRHLDGVLEVVDRLREGSVLDFVVVGRGWLSTNVFNVADVAIVAGALLFVFAEGLRRRRARATPPPG